MFLSNQHIKTHISKYKWRLFVILFLGVANSCITFLLAVSIGNFFSLRFNDAGTKSNLLHSLGMYFESYTSFVFFFCLVLLAKFVTHYFQQSLGNLQGELFAKGIREKVFAAQINWEEETFRQKSFGNYLLRYSNDMKSVQHYLVKGLMDGFRNVLFLLIGLTLIARINFGLSIIISFFLLTVSVLFFGLWKKQKVFISLSRDKRSSLLAFVTNQFGRFGRIKAGNQQVIIVQRFTEKSLTLYKANYISVRNEGFIQAMISILPFLVTGLLMLLIFAELINISHANAVTIVLIILMMQTPVKAILKIPGIIAKGKISLHKIDELIDKK
jgi:ABC-type multidrug transport system fused ATPase/permease subunit